MSPDEALRKIAAKQHGLATTSQALAVGLSRDALRHRVKRGVLTQVHRGVFAVGGALRTFEQDVLAAVLRVGEGAAASGITAAMMLGLIGKRPHVPHVAARKRHRARRGVVIHEADLRKSDIRIVDGIPVTAPNRTLVDFACEEALDEALRRGLTTVPVLRRYVRDRGVRNATLTALLNDREHGATQSALERLFLRKLRAAGLPEPKRQVAIGTYRVDFAYPDRRIAIELDGLASHFSAADFRADLRRQNALVLAGWTPLRFTWEDIARRWPATEAAVRETLE